MYKLEDKAPFTRNTTARNRSVMPPMDTLMAKDGMANDFHVMHYGARSYGGVGVVIVEACAVSVEGKIKERDLGIWSDDHVAPLKRIADVIKAGGALAGVQINHAGGKCEQIEINRVGATMYYDYIDQKNFRLATKEDLERIKGDFVKAAERAKRAGFAFVEIHAAHGYLLSELISPLLNQVIKSDSIVERAQLVIDIAKAIREQVKGIDVTIRFSVHDYEQGGNEPKDFEPLVKELEPYVDVFHISSGETVNRRGFDPKGDKLFRLPLGIEFRKLTDKPIILGANVSTREDIERVLAANLEFVGMGRALINNPNLVVNTLLPLAAVKDETYHWNNNAWYSNEKYNAIMVANKERKE